MPEDFDEVVRFTADFAPARRAYDQFIADTKGKASIPFGPAQVQGPPGPGNTAHAVAGGTTVLNGNATFVVNGQTTFTVNGNVSMNGGAGGSGGGGGGQNPNQPPQPNPPPAPPQQGMLQGVVRALAAYSVGSVVASAAQATAQYYAATTHQERFQAQTNFVDSFFRLPIFGQVAQLALMPVTAQGQLTMAQANQLGQMNDVMEQQNAFRRQSMGESMAYAAGPPGSYQFQRQQLTNQYREEMEANKLRGRQMSEQIEAERQLQRATAGTSEKLDKLGQFFSNPLTFWSEFSGIENKSDQAASSSDMSATGRLRANRAAVDEDNERSRQKFEALKAEQDFNRDQLTKSKQVGAEVEYLQFLRKPQVAQATAIAKQGLMEYEQLKHQGMDTAAFYSLDATQNRLLAMQRNITLEGSAQFLENGAQVDLSGGETSFARISDSPEALALIVQFLSSISQKIDSGRP